MNDVTVVVKTILRPEKCGPMLASLREHFDGPVIVCDDSPVPYPEIARGLDVQWIEYPTDVGIGYCLNDVVSNVVTTPYMAVMDDDFIVTKDTDMSRWIPFLEHDTTDIIGGAVRRHEGSIQNYMGTFVWGDNPRSLALQRIPQADGLTHVVDGLDIILNFYAARVTTLSDIGWDESLKVFRHEDFFIRARQLGKRVSYHPGVEVTHDMGAPYACKEYRDLRRGRIPEYRDVFLAKWGLTKEGLRL